MTDMRNLDKVETLRDKAKRALPAGSFGNVSGELVIARGKGGRVWDIDGKEYIDFLLGSGPMLVGHAHPEVIAAVAEQLPNGTTFFANNKPGIELAAEIVDAVACADKVRFLSSGSEATLYALRAARAFRKRDKIIKFEGGFHGMNDYALMSMSPRQPGNFPLPIPDTPGIPQRIRDDVLIAPFNDIDMVASLIAEHHDELAAVIVEPFQRVIKPRPGFLQAVRDLTNEYDIPLIFDEVVTGFRLAYGGAQGYYGVTPDLCALGKAIGGGFPLSAVAGREDIMAHFDLAMVGIDGFMRQTGTLSGNPVAATAGLATLAILKREGSYERIFKTGRILMQGLTDAMKAVGIAAKVIGEPPLFDIVFTNSDVHDYRSGMTGDAERGRRFAKLLAEHGVLKADTKFYISLAHDQDDIDVTLGAFKAVAKVLAAD